MGPLCSQIAEDCANGKGPEPCKTKKEQDEVDAVLKNEELRELLMNPKDAGAHAAVLGPAGLPGGDARSREPGHHREARAGGAGPAATVNLNFVTT